MCWVTNCVYYKHNNNNNHHHHHLRLTSISSCTSWTRILHTRPFHLTRSRVHSWFNTIQFVLHTLVPSLSASSSISYFTTSNRLHTETHSSLSFLFPNPNPNPNQPTAVRCMPFVLPHHVMHSMSSRLLSSVSQIVLLLTWTLHIHLTIIRSLQSCVSSTSIADDSLGYPKTLYMPCHFDISTEASSLNFAQVQRTFAVCAFSAPPLAPIKSPK